MSLAALILYGADKRKAVRGVWRIPEKVLLGISLLGGAVGGILGMTLFRHKTRHAAFWAANLFGLFWQLAVVLILFLYQFGWIG